MTDQAYLLIAGVALVASMWAWADVSERIGQLRAERKARREKAQWISDWLVSREQMREDRHRTGIDNGDEF